MRYVGVLLLSLTSILLRLVTLSHVKPPPLSRRGFYFLLLVAEYARMLSNEDPGIRCHGIPSGLLLPGIMTEQLGVRPEEG